MIKCAALICLLLPVAAVAGDHGCHSFFQQRHHVRHYAQQHHAAAVVKPVVVYQVAPHLSEQAAARYQNAADPSYLEFLKTEQRFREFKAFNAGRESVTGQAAQQATPIVDAHCATCHGRNSGGTYLAADASLDSDKITQAMRWLSGKSTPPDPGMQAAFQRVIDGKKQGPLLDELLSLETLEAKDPTP